LVKRYVREAETDVVRRLLSEGTAASSRLTEVEISSAIVRRSGEGGMSQKNRDVILSTLREDFASLYVVELSAAIVSLCHELLVRRLLRAGDVIQLASCIHLRDEVGQPTQFISYDQRLTEAAAYEGLEVGRV
jgi:predicted nucleic acid-binding protein